MDVDKKVASEIEVIHHLISHALCLSICTLAVPDSGEVDETESETDLPAKKKKPLNSLKPRTTTRTPLLTLAGHTQPASAVAWVREEEVVTAGWDHCIRQWDVATGVNKATLVRYHE